MKTGEELTKEILSQGGSLPKFTNDQLDRFLAHLGIDMTAEEYLAHYGVLGMKWGVRKDSSGRRRPTSEVLREQKTKRRTTSKKESVRNNNSTQKVQNETLSDEELRRIINRIQLERQYAQLTAPQKQQPSRMKSLMKDVAYDVTKGATTEVGKAILSQALKVEFNKRAGAAYQIPVKDIKKIVKQASGK